MRPNRLFIALLMPLRRLRGRWINLTAGVPAIFILLACNASLAERTQSVLQPGAMFRDCENCPEMVVILAGSYLMGSANGEWNDDLEGMNVLERWLAEQARAESQPQHLVTVDRMFALGKYHVTRGEFATFVSETGHVVQSGCTTVPKYRGDGRLGWQNPGFIQTDRDPVVCLSWHDTGAFISWLNEKSRKAAQINGGGTYRLPTEAAWEYAARGGRQATRWWGDSIGWGLANCRGCGSIWDGQRSAPVDAFMANAYGLVGMLGNAWQWTQDCWNPTYEGAPSDARPWTMGNCVARVKRGGDWGSSPWVVRSAIRSRSDTNYRANHIGFRVAKTLP